MHLLRALATAPGSGASRLLTTLLGLASLSSLASPQSSAGGDTGGGGGGGGATGGPSTTTPTSLVTCEPTSFTISGGLEPYFISILPGGQTGADPLEILPNLDTAGPVTWVVDQPAGTSVTIQVKDSNGALGFSQAETVRDGSDDSCVNGGAASASGAASVASSAASRVSSAASRATSVASSAASAASSAGSAAASAASSATSVAKSAASSATSAASSASAAAASNTQDAGIGYSISRPSVLLVGGVLTSLLLGALGGVMLF